MGIGHVGSWTGFARADGQPKNKGNGWGAQRNPHIAELRGSPGVKSGETGQSSNDGLKQRDIARVEFRAWGVERRSSIWAFRM